MFPINDHIATYTLKSECHPKLWTFGPQTPYKNTIKCFWMPFLQTFRYKYGKKIYSTVQVRETNNFWHLRPGGRYLLYKRLYKLQKFSKWKKNRKALPPKVSQILCSALISSDKLSREMRLWWYKMRDEEREHPEMPVISFSFLFDVIKRCCPGHLVIGSTQEQTHLSSLFVGTFFIGTPLKSFLKLYLRRVFQAMATGPVLVRKRDQKVPDMKSPSCPDSCDT